MTLTNGQQTAFDSIMESLEEVRQGDIFAEHSWLSLRGPAGTGKTFLSKAIVQALLDKNLTIAVIAPTHQAVKVIANNIDINHKNIVYSTLHSFLGLKPGEINPETGEQKFTKTRSKKKNSLPDKKFDVVILDESSMVGYELFEFLKKEMYEINRIKAFLFIGDSCQLMPIEKDKDFLDYKHPVYDNNIINHYNLTELIRNSDPEVINFVTVVRKMIENNGTKFDLFNFLVKERDKEHTKIKFYNSKKSFIGNFIQEERLQNTEDVIATFTNENVENYNNKIRDYYISKKYKEIPEITLDDLFVVQEGNDDFLNSEILKLKSITPKDFDFKGKSFKGYYCSTKEGRHFNYISKESKNEYNRALELLKANAIKTKDRGAWQVYFELVSLFLEVKYHYAATTHKSQGSSYRDIWVDMTGLGYVEDNMLLRLFYVAITRAKRNVHILL